MNAGYVIRNEGRIWVQEFWYGADLLAVQAVGLSVHSEGGGDGQERRGTQEPAAYARED